MKRQHPRAPVLTTLRLELRPFTPDDSAELHALFVDEGVRRWLLDDQVVARDWVDAEIAASGTRFGGGSAGLWAVRARGDDERARRRIPQSLRPILGFAGFRPFFDPPELQLLYGLLPAFWGKGLAAEAAGAAVAHAFEVLRFTEVRAATDVPNLASIAVLERLGFEEQHRTGEGERGTAHFRLTVTAWLHRRRDALRTT
jgi:ribosomal-protein-alanine N-acetyltransferase